MILGRDSFVLTLYYSRQYSIMASLSSRKIRCESDVDRLAVRPLGIVMWKSFVASSSRHGIRLERVLHVAFQILSTKMVLTSSIIGL